MTSRQSDIRIIRKEKGGVIEKDLKELKRKEGPSGILKEFRRAIEFYENLKTAANTTSMTPDEDLEKAEDAKRYSYKIEIFILSNCF